MFPSLADKASYLDYDMANERGVIASFDFKVSPEVAELLNMQARIINDKDKQKLQAVADRADYWEKTALGLKMRIEDLRGHWLIGRLIKWLCI